jgi:hypothetical protein
MIPALFARKASDADACQISIHGVWRSSSDHPLPRRVFPGRMPWRLAMCKLLILSLALALIWFISPALAQAPLTTKPNVSNLLTQCAVNVPLVGNGPGAPPICFAGGAFGTAAFVNTGTGVSTALAASLTRPIRESAVFWSD